MAWLFPAGWYRAGGPRATSSAVAAFVLQGDTTLLCRLLAVSLWALFDRRREGCGVPAGTGAVCVELEAPRVSGAASGCAPTALAYRWRGVFGAIETHKRNQGVAISEQRRRATSDK